MAGRVNEIGKDGSGVDQLAERRRRNQRRADTAPETTAPVEPMGHDASRVVEEPTPEPDPYSLLSSLGLDDKPSVVPDADEILDAISDGSPEWDTSFDQRDEDEIRARLHRHHERAARPLAGPHTPRGSAELSGHASPACRSRSTRARARRLARPRTCARALRAHPVRLLVAAATLVVIAGAVGVVLLLSGSSPRVSGGSSHREKSNAPAVATSTGAAAAKLIAPTGAMSTHLLTASTDATAMGKSLHQQVLAQQRAERQRKARQAHERAKRAAERKARQQKAAA